MEGYKEKYEKAIERARKLQETCNSQAVIGLCEYIFPELKESKDEKLRKGLIEAIHSSAQFINCLQKHGFKVPEVVDWLERQVDASEKVVLTPEAYERVLRLNSQKTVEWKQENNKFLTEFENAMLHVGESFFGKNHGLDPNNTGDVKEQATLLVELANKSSGWTDEDDKFIKDISIIINEHCQYFNDLTNADRIKWLESMKKRVKSSRKSMDVCADSERKSTNGIEPKFKVGDEIVDKDFPDNIFVVTELINNGFSFVDKNGERFTKYYDDDNWDEYELVEKNVESKFKVGDWIVSDKGDISQVTKINEYGDGYYLTDGTYFSGSWGDMYHLWTIGDAKPGDILSCDDEVVIFKYNDYEPYTQNGCMFVYCSIEKSGNYWFVIGGKNPTGFHPATKEEKEKLFKKMEEDGYAWNSYRLELSKTDDEAMESVKVVQKQSCAEERVVGDDRHYINNIEYAIKNTFKNENNPHRQSALAWLKNRLEEKNVDWTDEDEEMLEDVKNNFEYNKGEMTDGLVSQYDSFFDKIRKFKPQPKHKWSHNDEMQIREIINHLDASAKENPVRRRTYQSWIKWLKSLSPGGHWKPTEEQIATLMQVVNGTPVVKGSYIEGTLTELLNQLKEA